jgi:hypothetical protein
MTIYLLPEFHIFILPGSVYKRSDMWELVKCMYRLNTNLINFKMYSFCCIEVKHVLKILQVINVCSIHFKADVTVVVLGLLLYSSYNVNLQYFSVA